MAQGAKSWQNCPAMSRRYSKDRGSEGFRFARAAWQLSILSVLSFGSIFVLASIGTSKTVPTRPVEVSAALWQDGAPKDSKQPRGVEIVEHGGYPELRVDGEPFFLHSAAFFYYRIPRDLWEPMLDRYRSLGINTLDLYIPWNWHEPKEGELDFDGHSNPRRDLRSLLTFAAQKGFKIIVRPGPEILNEWRHGGYPSWLLERPEYHMDPLDWVEGRYPPLDNLNAHDAEGAARGWLENSTHMEATKSWFAAVAKELAPYSSRNMIHVKPESHDAPPRDISGPLLFVQLGDDFAIGRTNRVGTDFWRYVEELRGMLEAGGLDAPVFINPTDMRVSAAGSAQNPPIGAMGQWYMHPREGPGTSARSLTTVDAAELEFFSEELKTQPNFPPAMIEYQAGWYATGDDDRPRPSLPENTLLSSRLLIANGIHGFNYFPLQDTFTPAGYSVPWSNQSYRWDAALSPGGEQQPRLEAVRRNSQLLQTWGTLLAASHKRADFGIIYPLGAFPQDLLTAADIQNVSESVMRIERLCALATLSSELLDPEYQPISQLLRDPLLLLPTFDSKKPQFHLSDRAQSAIVEYVRQGGVLAVFPARPAGQIIGQLWKDASGSTVSSESAIRSPWKFGKGEVMESSRDFYSWLSLEESVAENKSRQASDLAIGVLNEFVATADILPTVRFSGKRQGAEALFLSEIVTNEGTESLGNRKGGRGFLSATNLAEHETVDANVDILSPSASARGGQGPYSSLHLVVPPRESMLLPVEMPLCFANRTDIPCSDSIPVAGAEFLDARREGKTLELAFYVPARGDVRLQLGVKPSRISLDEADTKPDSTWSPDSRELQLTIPRGAAPTFRRTIKLDVENTPHVAEVGKRKQPGKAPPEDMEYYVQNAVRFPTSENAFLRTNPALVAPNEDGKIGVLVIGENRNQSADGYAELSFDKPLHGSKNLVVPPHGTASETLEFKVAEAQPAGTPPPRDHLFRAAIEVHSGHDRRVLPITVLLHTEGVPDRYRFDFDRDGADEWVLENDRLRLIVSPESGGRALALIDKSWAASVSTSVGLLRDGFSFTENPPGISQSRTRGKYGLFNRPYAAAWNDDGVHATLNLQYEAADIFPAGAKIDKSIQLDSVDTVRVDYRIALHAKGAESVGSPVAHPQSFVVVNSFPAEAGAGEAGSGTSTRFCWQTKSLPASSPGASAPSGSDVDGQDCEDFRPDGNPIEPPQGISTIEIHSPGRAGIEISWDCSDTCARLTIEPKSFSALFRLEYPPLTPGADAAKYSMRIRVLPTP
jgi:hypothetical protein